MKQTYTLITGASSGIGAALAREAAADGRSLVLVARNRARLEALAKELPVKTTILIADLSVSSSATKLSEQLKKQHIAIDQLINNAGVGDTGAFHEASLETQTAMIQLNITSLVELTHLLLPSIIEHKGKIMNVASVAGFIPGPYMSVYYASKAFVLSFSQALSEEMRDNDVTVTCLCPGPTKTNFASSARASASHPVSTATVTADSVASSGYRDFTRGKTLSIPGTRNKIAVLAISRLIPRSLVRKAVARVQRANS